MFKKITPIAAVIALLITTATTLSLQTQQALAGSMVCLSFPEVIELYGEPLCHDSSKPLELKVGSAFIDWDTEITIAKNQRFNLAMTRPKEGLWDEGEVAGSEGWQNFVQCEKIENKYISTFICEAREIGQVELFVKAKGKEKPYTTKVKIKIRPEKEGDISAYCTTLPTKHAENCINYYDGKKWNYNKSYHCKQNYVRDGQKCVPESQNWKPPIVEITSTKGRVFEAIDRGVKTVVVDVPDKNPFILFANFLNTKFGTNIKIKVPTQKNLRPCSSELRFSQIMFCNKPDKATELIYNVGPVGNTHSTRIVLLGANEHAPKANLRRNIVKTQELRRKQLLRRKKLLERKRSLGL